MSAENISKQNRDLSIKNGDTLGLNSIVSFAAEGPELFPLQFKGFRLVVVCDMDRFTQALQTDTGNQLNQDGFAASITPRDAEQLGCRVVDWSELDFFTQLRLNRQIRQYLKEAAAQANLLTK